MPSFLAPEFAIAGLVVAAGPIIIHLLNRRHYRIIEWAAMDFLREAIHRSRRILQLRDLVLMALRMLCLVLLGLALARPHTAKEAAATSPDQPVHAVILVDNSLGMSYQKLEGTLLDEAKTQIKEVVEQLPRGSRISILPTCSPPSEFSVDAYFTPEEAMEALARIRPVDRQTRPGQALDLALDACRRLPQMRAKKICFFTDHHAVSWPGESVAEQLKQLPCRMEVRQVIAEGYENAWVADFKLRDGIADLQTPGVFVATIGYDGPQPRSGVQVTLTVDGMVAATQTIDLEPGQMREVTFPPYRFEAPAEPGKPAFVAAEVSIPHDRLALDDHRFLVVPVAAAVPVVFVDQYGPEEAPRRNLYGETFYLRRLLAPLTSRTGHEQQLIQIRHLKIDQLSREALADARLLVIAGVASPRGAAPLVREYVRQGGNVIIAAGGEFDPAAWNEAAWADGLGILPAPLAPAAVGKTPEESAGRLEPMHLEFDSLQHPFFLVEGASEEEMKDLYAAPFFFKVVSADAAPGTQDAAMKALAGQLKQEQDEAGEIDRKLGELAKRQAKAAAGQMAELENQRNDLQQQRAAIYPNWLLWQTGDEDAQETAEKAAEHSHAMVLGKYSKDGLPFMVQRKLGRGQVLLVTTGVASGPSGWNTLPLTNTMLLFDRILRTMLLDTLPLRNLETDQQLLLPVAAADRQARFVMTDSGGQERALSVDALGGDRYGITLRNWQERGIYKVAADRTSNAQEAPSRPGEVLIAVNGPAEESRFLASAEPTRRHEGNRAGFLDAVQVSATSSAPLPGRELWQWAMIAVLAGLLVEVVLVALTYRGGGRTA